MLRDTQKKLFQFLLYSLVSLCIIIQTPAHAHLTSLAKNDAIPMFTTLNIDEEFLLTKEQLLYKFDGSGGTEYEWADKKRNRFGFSLSPFAQNADRGKPITGQACNITDDPCPWKNDTPLGDLTGRTGMIALLYGDRPEGEVYLPGGPDGVLSLALENLFDVDPDEIISDEGDIDPKQEFGYFSFPLTYRKRGVAFELAARFASNFGILLQARVSTIRQVRQATDNLTNESSFDPETDGVDKDTVNLYLMNELDAIADEIGVNLCNFIATSLEEVRFNLFWRQAFPMNEDAESDWARFLIIPYVEAGVSAAPGKRENDFKFFAAPFGNNGHTAVGFTTGINLDFMETIEIGGEIGYTHFFKRTYCRPIPNSEFQTNLFPFSTEVAVQPGDNWYFGARIAAYHFIDHLSMYFEWFVLDHAQDSICLTKPDPAFLPEVLECTTSFKTKLGNAGFNYDLSPNVGVGFLWQIPFSQRNSYRSSTIMVSLNVTF